MLTGFWWGNPKEKGLCKQNFWYLVYEMHIDNRSNYILYLLFMCIVCICKEL